MIVLSHHRDQDFNSHQKYHFCLALSLHEPQTVTYVSSLVHKRLNFALENEYADPYHHLYSFCALNIHRYLAT
jgi:hypothetical protein